MNIQSYMTRGVTKVVLNAVRVTAKNKKEAAFMRAFAKAAAVASRKRANSEKNGEHIPPFLIASITSVCNLHCAGCYSRANHACHDDAADGLLRAEEWDRIFAEAEDIGISFILLAGGEPLMRRDVLESAAKHPGILFPVFTNGTCINDRYFALFDRHRNLLPVISIEGDREITDRRRGAGVFDKISAAMEKMKSAGIVFGASVTVTKENMREIYSDEFVSFLSGMGCKAIIYVEYVPVDGETDKAPDEPEREWMKKRIRALRLKKREMVYISFPGDEKSSGGCVAAGRGFFHINPHGGAEPCPFSPYSDCSVRDTSIREALRSPLFYALNAQGLLKDDHAGGCTLFANREQVEQIVSAANAKIHKKSKEKSVMDIKAVKFRTDGFYSQPFVFGGEEGPDKFDPSVRYRGSLQNYLIDTGSEIILVDTGLPAGTPEEVPDETSALYTGKDISSYMEAFAALGYRPEQVTKILLTHKHGDHSGELRSFPNAKIFVNEEETTADELQGLTNVVPVKFTDGAYYGFPESQKIVDGVYLIKAKGHTNGNSIVIAENDGLFYMFHGDITYVDEALYENKVSVVFDDLSAARETLNLVREFVRSHPTVYCGTHTPQGYENLEAKRVIDLDDPVPTVLAEVDFTVKEASGKYVCSICGYVYDPAEHDGVAFEDLPDDWKCPRCKQPKEKFNKA